LETTSQEEQCLATHGNMYLAQLTLEENSKRAAEDLLKASMEKAKQDGTAADTTLGKKLTDLAWQTCRENVKALIDIAIKPKRGVVGGHTALLKQLIDIYDDAPDDLAHLLTLASLAEALNACFRQRDSISHIGDKIMSAVLDEASIHAYMKDKTKKEAQKFNKLLDERVQLSYRQKFARNWIQKNGATYIKWSAKERATLGAKLVEAIVKGSDYFCLKEHDVNGKYVACLEPKEWLVETWRKNVDLLANYSYHFIPTIIPPKTWEEPYNGGYYGAYQRFGSLIRMHDGGANTSNKFIRDYKARLAQVDLTQIYSVLNALQDTPFIVNRDMLAIIHAIMDTGGGLGLPRLEPEAKLPDLPEPYTEEELKDHKRKQVTIIKRNTARASKTLRLLATVAAADKFKEYEKIYFPWNMDYRGRCYPIPNSLSPQGDDVAKSLLLFADPKPCTSDDDLQWLAIHGANQAGQDKIPLQERAAWIKAHEEQIIHSANDPLGYTWWHDVAQNDYPLEFLAFCIEWQKARAFSLTHGTLKGFKTGLPIAFDGSCSGLQHFSGLLRDEIGGRAVNLTPSPTVQDIYTIVAEKVNLVLRKDAQEGTPDDVKRDAAGEPAKDKQGSTIPIYGSKYLAQTWLTFARDKYGTDGIPRKVCKRSVMTLAYGSGQYGFKENLLADIIKPYIYDHPDQSTFLDNTHNTQAATYMAALIWQAVANTVVKAVEGMKWLQKVAKAITKERNVVTWTTPNGLPVQQNYTEVNLHAFEMRVAKHKKRFYYLDNQGNIDKRRQANGISPNFIHSMDAAHLQRVVAASHRRGNKNFAMIHDSFGTDLAHAGELFKITREEFVNLYEQQDYFQNFLEDIAYLLDEKTKKALEESKPSFGNLNIKEVMQSDFCFA
jgi:DNA-directed RNA polymerase